ncbi:MAG: nucleoside kinase [Bacilli bacterium]|nr:nucleoside kinase [Bacilli bacterium]
MENIKIKYKDKEYDYTRGITLFEISKDFKDDYKDTILIGEFNGRPCELNYVVNSSGIVNFYDRTSKDGARVYESGLVFILIEAFKNILKSDVEIKYSMNSAIYIQTKKKITKDSLDKVTDEMNEIIKKDLPIKKNLVNRMDAINYYNAVGEYDKINVLKYSINTNVNLYRLNDTYDYFFSYLPVSTGVIKDFKLIYLSDHEFVLAYSNIYYKEDLSKYVNGNKLFEEFKKYDNWCKKSKINNVSELNSRVTKGNINDLIFLSESNRNRKLLNISEDIFNNKNIKIVLMSGPSSSGKTTTSKKLQLFLSGNGVNPISLSIDDYFLDREKTPKLKDGSYDFESIKAVNVKKFNKDLKDLLDGKEVYPMKYNFILGKGVQSNESIKLEDNDILIIEGLHALNDELTSSIDDKYKYKMFVCHLTVLSLDNHNVISSSDIRLLRRVVRDNLTRGYNASQTIENWKKVKEGEEKYVYTYNDQADVVYNTSLLYEIGVIKVFAEPLLFSLDESDPNYKEAIRLLNLLKNVLPVPTDFIPADSILREFIGGSYFK